MSQFSKFRVQFTGSNHNDIRIWASKRTNKYWNFDNDQNEDSLILKSADEEIVVEAGEYLGVDHSGIVKISGPIHKEDPGLITNGKTTLVLSVLLVLFAVSLAIQIAANMINDFQPILFAISIFFAVIAGGFIMVWDNKRLQVKRDKELFEDTGEKNV